MLYKYCLKCHPDLVEGQKFNTVVLDVTCREFTALNLTSLQKENKVVYEVKWILQNNVYWQLLYGKL